MSRKVNSVPDPRDVFPECKSFVQPRNTFEPKIQSINKGNLLCILGSIMIAGKGDYQVTGAIPYEVQNSEDFQYNKTETVKNALAVIGNEVHVNVYPVSKVECLEDDGCKIQFMRVSHSIVEYGTNKNKGNLSYAYGKRFIVSTANKGKFTLSQYATINKNKKTQDVFDETDFTVISAQQMTMKWKRSKYGDFEHNNIKDHESTSGEISASTTFNMFSDFNDKESEQLLNVYNRGEDVSLEGHVSLEWKPLSSGSETEWYFPEITATLSTEEGIFTKGNIDQDFPLTHSSGLSGVAIFFIVLGVICVIVVPIVAIYLIKNKKNQHYDTI